MQRAAPLAAIGLWMLAATCPAVAGRNLPLLAQAAPLAGEWASSEPCAASASRLRFAGNTFAFLAARGAVSEYEVEITESGDRVTVRVLRVIADPGGPGGLVAGSRMQYRRDGDGLRVVGMANPGGQFMSPTVATLYRRCK
jgi:hypothetical protein